MNPTRLWLIIQPYAHELTAEAEGTYAQCNHTHWPGGASGVTLGRGLDCKLRSAENILTKLAAAQIDAPWMAEAAGLSGEAARRFCHRYKAWTISDKQIDALFDECAKEILSTVFRISNGKDVRARYGEVGWATVNPTVLALVVDMCYRGDYTGATRKLGVQRALSTGAMTRMMRVLTQNPWSNVPTDRQKRRLLFAEKYT